MHRNTYLFVSILAVLAALVVGVNVGKKISPAGQSPLGGALPTPIITVIPTPQLQTFVDKACGFSLQYGSEFSLIDSATGGAILKNANDTSQSIAMTCQKGLAPPAAGNSEPLFFPTTMGASISAKLYHGQSNQTGTPIDIVVFTHPTSRLDVLIAGYGDGFNALLKTIQILP